MNIGALLLRHARYRPDHLALVVGEERLTYRKLNAVVNRLANALLFRSWQAIGAMPTSRRCAMTACCPSFWV